MDAGSDSRARRETRTPGRLARRFSQYALVATVVGATLLIGGAPSSIQVALAFGALLATAAWGVSRRGELRLAPFMAAGLVAVVGTLLQLIPLPGGLVETLSPRALEIRTDAAGRRPAFLPLTLDVPGTVLAGLRSLSFVAILLVTAKAVRWRGRTMQFALALTLAGGALALLSFAQRWFGADGILGLYTIREMPGSGFFGTFVNGNHAASFFSLTALLALGCLREETQGPLKLSLGLSAFLSGLAVVSTGSRTGLLGLAAGLGAFAACLLVKRLGTRRGLAVSAAIAAVAGPLAVLASAAQRRPLSAGWFDALLAEQKLRGWKAAVGVVRAYPWTGVGRGAFEGPAAVFRTDQEGVRLVFPENLPLQLLSEWGIPLTLAVAVLAAVPAIQVARRLPRWEPVFQGAACGVVAVLVHEIADFGMEIPGVAYPMAMAIGLCAGRLQMSEPGDPSERGRIFGWPVLGAALGTWALVVAAGLWAMSRTSEDEGLRARDLARQNTPEAARALAAIIQRHPAEHYFELLAARQSMNRRDGQTLRHLNRALLLFPRSVAPHLLAFHYLSSVGLRQQAAMEYRLAVELGYPFNYEEVARRVGPENVARAVRQQPDDLLNLANAFVQGGRLRDAETVSARAVDLSGGSEPTRIRRLEIALASKNVEFIRKAAVELGRIAISARGYELAADGLAMSGDLAGAKALIRQGLEAQPDDTGMPARAGRILFNHGDLQGARSLLVGRSINRFPARDRIAVDKLLADIAEKEGATETAAAARARARILERLQGAQQP